MTKTLHNAILIAKIALHANGIKYTKEELCTKVIKLLNK